MCGFALNATMQRKWRCRLMRVLIPRMFQHAKGKEIHSDDRLQTYSIAFDLKKKWKRKTFKLVRMFMCVVRWKEKKQRDLRRCIDQVIPTFDESNAKHGILFLDWKNIQSPPLRLSFHTHQFLSKECDQHLHVNMAIWTDSTVQRSSFARSYVSQPLYAFLTHFNVNGADANVHNDIPRQQQNEVENTTTNGERERERRDGTSESDLHNILFCCDRHHAKSRSRTTEATTDGVNKIEINYCDVKCTSNVLEKVFQLMWTSSRNIISHLPLHSMLYSER